MDNHNNNNMRMFHLQEQSHVLCENGTYDSIFLLFIYINLYIYNLFVDGWYLMWLIQFIKWIKWKLSNLRNVLNKSKKKLTIRINKKYYWKNKEEDLEDINFRQV